MNVEENHTGELEKAFSQNFCRALEHQASLIWTHVNCYKRALNKNVFNSREAGNQANEGLLCGVN